MRDRTNSYGTNRDNKRNISFTFIGIFTACFINVTACSPTLEEPQGDKPLKEVVNDWEDSGSVTTSPDSVRDATHADSVRLGLIPH